MLCLLHGYPHCLWMISHLSLTKTMPACASFDLSNLFGTPSTTEPWGFNFYGHHLCLNITFVGRQMVISPTFFGAEPDIIDEGKHKGLTLFRGEEVDGLKLMQGLSEALRTKAQLYPNVSLAVDAQSVSTACTAHLALTSVASCDRVRETVSLTRGYTVSDTLFPPPSLHILHRCTVTTCQKIVGIVSAIERP